MAQRQRKATLTSPTEAEEVFEELEANEAKAEDFQTEPEPEAPAMQATLVNGSTYYLREKRFEWNKPLPVTGDEMTWLQENAIDNVMLVSAHARTSEPRQKFRFSEVPQAVPASPRRLAR